MAKWIGEKKLVVFYEVMEMYAIPVLQISKSAIMLKWTSIPIYLSAVLGRTWGLTAFSLKKTFKSKPLNASNGYE
ncbi:hypothetical protein D3C87_1951080 [compost metagenome]